MRLIIEPTYELLSQWAAHYVAAKIKKSQSFSREAVCIGVAYRLIALRHVQAVD